MILSNRYTRLEIVLHDIESGILKILGSKALYTRIFDQRRHHHGNQTIRTQLGPFVPDSGQFRILIEKFHTQIKNQSLNRLRKE